MKGKADGPGHRRRREGVDGEGRPAGMVKMEMTADVAGQKMEMTMELTESGNKK